MAESQENLHVEKRRLRHLSMKCCRFWSHLGLTIQKKQYKMHFLEKSLIKFSDGGTSVRKLVAGTRFATRKL